MISYALVLTPMQDPVHAEGSKRDFVIFGLICQSDNKGTSGDLVGTCSTAQCIPLVGSGQIPDAEACRHIAGDLDKRQAKAKLTES